MRPARAAFPRRSAPSWRSTSFENAIRLAISLGGDSDTLACITGGIAQAFTKACRPRLKSAFPDPGCQIIRRCGYVSPGLQLLGKEYAFHDIARTYLYHHPPRDPDRVPVALHNFLATIRYAGFPLAPPCGTARCWPKRS